MNARHWIAPDWPAPAAIRAATTLRSGGVSDGAYDSLNLALHVGDRADSVQRNRSIATEMLALPAEPVWLEQVHGNRVVDAAGVESALQADASYTYQTGVVCAVMTADCLPLLLCSADGNGIAAVHAGWRGLLSGVIGNAVAALPADLLAWLGPAIGPDCFMVGDDVRDAFLGKSPAYACAFKPSSAKWQADIYRLARIELAALGVNKVFGGAFCTVTEQQRFYSYRRDKETGRMATLIWKE